MRLKKLSLKNIRSYENQVIEFPEGSFLLSGDVGSGKTTILLAIEYALFGLQPGQRGAAILRNSFENGEVSLDLEVEGSEITIERHLKRDNRSIVSNYAAITINGETQECSVTELKSKILAILGYPPEFLKKNNLLYKYTVYTPQEQMKQIVMEDTETRLNILRHIFGIDKYKRIRENLSMLLINLKEESKVLQGEIRTIENDKSQLSQIKLRSNEISNELGMQKENLTKVCSQKKSLESEFQDLEQNLKEKEKFEKEIEKTALLISFKKENLVSLKKEIESLGIVLSDSVVFNEDEYSVCLANLSQEKINQEKINNLYLTLIGQRNAINESKSSNTKHKEHIFNIDVCPTCLQNVSDTYKYNIFNDIELKIVKIGKQLKELDSQIDSQDSALEKKNKMIDDLEQEKYELEKLKTKSTYLEISKSKLVEVKKSEATLEKDISLLEKHVSGLKKDLFSFSNSEVKYKMKKEDLAQSTLLEKKSEISLASLNKEKEMLDSSTNDLLSTIKRKEALDDDFKRITLLINWLSTNFLNLVNFTEIQILMKLRREFSQIFSHWFHMIAGDSFTVQLDENFTPILLQGDVEMDYSFLSGGERTAVALAYRLALNQTINSVLSKIKTKDLVILDEPTDGFSEAQIDKIRDVLEELKIGQLIVVSHEQKIEGFVDSVLRLNKSSGVSEIETPGSPDQVVNHRKT